MMEQPYSDDEQQQIRNVIRTKYHEVASSAQGLFRYPTGKKGAAELGYDPDILSLFSENDLQSFCGVGNPFGISPIRPGSRVLDVGCGAGFDLIVARKLVGDQGYVAGIDLTEAMVEKAQLLVGRVGDEGIAVQHVQSESIPFAADSFDHVISNGVINLSPSKLKLFREVRRVLAPKGILQFADVSLGDGEVAGQRTSFNDWAQ